jgi:hypothetical protein
MARVPVIASTYFDFGAPPKSGSQAVSEAPQNQAEGGETMGSSNDGGG